MRKRERKDGKKGRQEKRESRQETRSEQRLNGTSLPQVRSHLAGVWLERRKIRDEKGP